jgi:hypothetical protein
MEQLRQAALRHIPDLAQHPDILSQLLIPAAIGALITFAILLLIFGDRVAVLAAALATVVAFVWVNYKRPIFDNWGPELVGLAFIPILCLIAQIDGLLTRNEGVPWWGKWRLRIGVGLLAALLLLPKEWQEKWWPIAAYAAAIAISWGGLDELTKQSPGGNIPLLLSISFFMSSLLILHAHFGKASEALNIPAASLLGIALVSFLRPTDVGGALPGSLVMFYSCLVMGHVESYSDVPMKAFLIAGLSPIALSLAACPPINQWTGRWKWLITWLLCLVPAGVGLYMAMQAEVVN